MVSTFILKTGFLCVLIVLTVVVVVFVVPDKNDYHDALIDKHAMLRERDSPRLILIGGSSLAFGLDSPALGHVLRRNVINMGLDATLGLRFILDEVKPHMRAGDVIVVFPEYIHFTTLVEGRERTLAHAAKAYPGMLAYLHSPQQYLMILKGIPTLMQIKVDRLMKTFVRSLVRDKDFNRRLAESKRIYTRSGFNNNGDVISHLLDKTTVIEAEDEPGLVAAAFNGTAVDLLNEFAQYGEGQGCRIFLRYTNLPLGTYRKNQKLVDAFHERLLGELQFKVLGSPAAFVLPDTCFFDSIYHLTAEGRRINTAMTLELLLRESENEPGGRM